MITRHSLPGANIISEHIFLFQQKNPPWKIIFVTVHDTGPQFGVHKYYVLHNSKLTYFSGHSV